MPAEQAILGRRNWVWYCIGTWSGTALVLCPVVGPVLHWYYVRYLGRYWVHMHDLSDWMCRTSLMGRAVGETGERGLGEIPAVVFDCSSELWY